MKQFSWLLAIICGLSTAAAQEKPAILEHVARERSYDVLHYKLNIEIDEKAKTCKGDASIKLVPLRSQFTQVRLDAAEMMISKVLVDGKLVDHHEAGETLFVDLGNMYGLRDTLNLTVAYAVSSPKQGLYFIKPDSGYPKKQWQVWSNGEAVENHFWFPCYDFPNDKATSEMIVTVNENWTAISNGRLIDVRRDPKRHKATYHWFEGKPHVSYLISLVAGEYVEVKDSWGAVPLSYFVYKHQKDDALRSFEKSPKIMDFFSSRTGYPYPWEKYAQTVVQDYIVGGQENVSATTLTDGTIHDGRAHLDMSSDGLVAHEMAHQWFGDLLTCRDWSHLWLNEGFASYFDVLFQEYDKGSDVALKSIYDAQHNIVTSDVADKRRPSVFSRYVNPNDMFDYHIYGKGACVLHMMRFVLGDDLFWKAIDHYVDKFAFQPVETNDFKIAVEEATGYNLHWFFEEWLYKAGYPEFEVSTGWDGAAHAVNVRVKQTQKIDSLTGIFTMPVEIEVWTHDEPATYRATISKEDETFSFPSYQQPQLVIFDKSSRLLKKASFQKSLDEWIYQLQHAAAGVDRIAAVEELRWLVDSANVSAALSSAAINDRFSDVRREAVWALGDARRKDVVPSLIGAYGDGAAKVRAAAVAGLKNREGAQVLQTLQHAFDKDSSYVVAAGALTALMKNDSLNAKSYAKAGLTRDSYREGIRIAALRGLADVGDESAFDLVKQYTFYGNDRNVRMEALGILSRKWKDRPTVVPYLLSMINDPSFHVRRAVMEMLGNLGDEQAMAQLQKVADAEADVRLVKVAREAIEKLKKSKPPPDVH